MQSYPFSQIPQSFHILPSLLTRCSDTDASLYTPRFVWDPSCLCHMPSHRIFSDALIRFWVWSHDCASPKMSGKKSKVSIFLSSCRWSLSAPANRKQICCVLPVARKRDPFWYHYSPLTVIEWENNTKCFNNTRLWIHPDVLVIMLARCSRFVWLHNPNWTSDGRRFAQPLNYFGQVMNRMYGFKHWSKVVSKIRKLFFSFLFHCFLIVEWLTTITIVQEFTTTPLLALCSRAVGGGFWNRKHRLDPCFLHCALFMFQRLPAFLCHFSGLWTALPTDGHIMIY